MYRREVALPSNNVGPGKSSAITTSFPFRSMPSELPFWMLKSMELAQYPLSIIINSFTPNQQGHNMLQLQLSTIFPLKFHVIAMCKPIVIFNFDGLLIRFMVNRLHIPMEVAVSISGN